VIGIRLAPGCASVLRTKASELRNRILPLSDLAPDLDASIATWKQERWISSAEVTVDGCPFAQRTAPQRDKFQISVHSHERLVLAFWSGGYSTYQVIVTLRTVLGFAVAVLCCCLLSIPAIAQQQPQQDPGNERRLGLRRPFAEQISGVRIPSTVGRGSLELLRVLLPGGIGFHLRRWLTLMPIYRYQRYPGDPATPYENRLLLNLTLSTTEGRLRRILRTLMEGRLPKNRIASARVRLRPGIEYTLPLRMKRPPVVVVNNEFFVVLGVNIFAAGSDFTQNRLQAGVRLPITDSFAIRPYYCDSRFTPNRLGQQQSLVSRRS
jgi:hypothetical protein